MSNFQEVPSKRSDLIYVEAEPEFSAEPIYGFRAWHVDEANNLVAYYDDAAKWVAYEPLVCSHARQSSKFGPVCEPGVPCGSCGIYAFQDYEHLRELMINEERSFQRQLQIRGAVAGWGYIKVTERGFRAGTAYPLAFLDWEVSPLYVENGIDLHFKFHKTANKYGVPILADVEELVAYAEEQGCVAAT